MRRIFSSSSDRSSTEMSRLLAPSSAATISSSFNCTGQSVAVLRALNEEDHQEGDHGRPCVNDKLPRV